MNMSRSFSRSFSRPFSRTLSAGLGATGAVLKFLAIVANSAGAMVGVSKGVGDLTEACTSVRYLPDHESIYRDFGSAEPAYKGGRVVENTVLELISPLNSTSDMTGASSSQCAISFANGESTLTVTGASGNSFVRWSKRSGSQDPPLDVGDTITMSCRIKGVAGSVGKDVYIVSESASDIGTPEPRTLSSEYQIVEFERPAKTNAFNEYIYTGLRLGAEATLAENDQIKIKDLQYEITTGHAVKVASERVETKAIFTTENGNSVDGSGVVTEAPGAALAELPWLYCGPAATNSAIYSNNATNAAWAKTNMTTAFDAVGLDGALNNGSTLTANAANATIYQTITAASGEHAARFYLRRKTGTGTIEITVDGGTTWTGVALTVAYQEFSVDKAALTNPQIGIRIVTSADAVEMGNGECYLTSAVEDVRAMSPIFTSGSSVTVNATDLSFDDVNHPLEGGYFVEWQPQYSTSEVSGDVEIISLDNNAGLLYYDATNSLLKSTDGTNTASVALTIVSGITYKIWVAYGETNLQVGVDAVTGTLDTYDGAFATGTKIEVCTPSSNVSLVRNLRAYDGSFDNAVSTLQELAA